MIFLGDASLFADFLPDGKLPDILRLVVSAWDSVWNVKATDLECDITEQLCEASKTLKNRRTDLPFKIRVELCDRDPDTGGRTRLDLVFDSINSPWEDVYFTFECKRLRVHYSSGLDRLAGEYVSEGMMRFINGRYSPYSQTAGMIAYVMDGHVPKAIVDVSQAVATRWNDLRLRSGTGLEHCTIVPDIQHARVSCHALSERNFEIYHLFLGVDAG